MLTQNFYNHLMASLTSGTTTMKDANGTTVNVDLRNSTTLGDYTLLPLRKYMGTFPSSWNTSGVFFGTNSAAPALNNHCLHSTMITGLGITCNIEHIVDGTSRGIKATYTIANNNSTTVNICEIVLAAYLRVSSASTSYAKYFIIDRSVFDTVTIPAGGVGRIYYTIMMPDITPAT